MGVIAVADGDDEVLADQDHDLAGLDHFTGGLDRLVLDVLHRAQDEELEFVVDLQFRALVRVHGVLDDQLVQPESLCDALHLAVVGRVQSEPDKTLSALADLPQRLGVGVLARQAYAVDVDGAVDDRAGYGYGDARKRGLVAT